MLCKIYYGDGGFFFNEGARKKIKMPTKKRNKISSLWVINFKKFAWRGNDRNAQYIPLGIHVHCA